PPSRRCWPSRTATTRRAGRYCGGRWSTSCSTGTTTPTPSPASASTTTPVCSTRCSWPSAARSCASSPAPPEQRPRPSSHQPSIGEQERPALRQWHAARRGEQHPVGLLAGLRQLEVLAGEALHLLGVLQGGDAGL